MVLFSGRGDAQGRRRHWQQADKLKP